MDSVWKWWRPCHFGGFEYSGVFTYTGSLWPVFQGGDPLPPGGADQTLAHRGGPRGIISQTSSPRNELNLNWIGFFFLSVSWSFVCDVQTMCGFGSGGKKIISVMLTDCLFWHLDELELQIVSPTYLNDTVTPCPSPPPPLSASVNH